MKKSEIIPVIQCVQVLFKLAVASALPIAKLRTQKAEVELGLAQPQKIAETLEDAMKAGGQMVASQGSLVVIDQWIQRAEADQQKAWNEAAAAAQTLRHVMIDSLEESIRDQLAARRDEFEVLLRKWRWDDAFHLTQEDLESAVIDLRLTPEDFLDNGWFKWDGRSSRGWKYPTVFLKLAIDPAHCKPRLDAIKQLQSQSAAPQSDPSVAILYICEVAREAVKLLPADAAEELPSPA